MGLTVTQEKAGLTGGKNVAVGRDSWAPGEGRGAARDAGISGRAAWVCGGRTGARGAEGRLTKGDGPTEAHRAGEAVSHVPQWRGSAWAILSESFSELLYVPAT